MTSRVHPIAAANTMPQRLRGRLHVRAHLAPAALATLAALGTLAALAACSSADEGTTSAVYATATAPSDTVTSLASDQPIDLSQVPSNTPLEPGTYDMALLAVDSSMRAFVDVPKGYFARPGGRVIDDGNELLKPDRYGDVAFWGRVDQVDADPCFGGGRVPAGTTVHDLVSALVAQRHRTTSIPVPVTVGGYHGVYLRATGTVDLDRCRSGEEHIFGTARGEEADWLVSSWPGTVNHLWILNVGGQRVVAGARVAPGYTTHPVELIHMVESAEFSGDRPQRGPRVGGLTRRR